MSTTIAMLSEEDSPNFWPIRLAAITAGGTIPVMFSCRGTNVSPPLAWTGGPSAPGYAVVLTDRNNNLVHSIIWDIPGTRTDLPEQNQKNVFDRMRASYPFGAVPPTALQRDCDREAGVGHLLHVERHRLVGELLRQTLTSTLLAKLGALLARGALKRLQMRIDPRRVNGGVFLGLNGTVVKSHGSADATGIAAAIGLAYQLAQVRFLERLAARVASAEAAGQDAAQVGPDAPETGGSPTE